MKTVKIKVDETVYQFYQKVGQQAGVCVEQVMSDALFKFAGELSLSVIQKKEGRFPPL